MMVFVVFSLLSPLLSSSLSVLLSAFEVDNFSGENGVDNLSVLGISTRRQATQLAWSKSFEVGSSVVVFMSVSRSAEE